MKTDLRRFAPLGLVISLLAVLTFVGTLIVKGLFEAKIFVLEDPKVLDQTLWVCIGVFVFGFALTGLLNPDGARKFFIGRQLQYGSNSLLLLAAFAGVVFFINMLVYQYQGTPWDWTDDKQNTLASETLTILKSLKQPITAHAYYTTPDETVQTLLNSFKQNSGGNFTFEIIDPKNDPMRARADGITQDATVALLMGENRELVEYANEQNLDAAIIRLTNPAERTVYFLTGHGERDTETSGDTSLSFVKALLQNKNYTVKVLTLSGQKTVPADAKAVVIAGPQVALSQDEVNVLDAYLTNGGSVIVMEEPSPLTKMGDAADPLATMLTKWGITLQNNIILDSNMTNGLMVAADPQHYASHPITEKLMGYLSGYYTARSISLSATAPEGVTLIPLAQSLASGVWGETDFKSIENNNAVLNPEVDTQAPLTLAVAAENSFTKARLVVFGDVDFASDALNQQGQTLNDILLNAIDWGAQEESLINLTPRNNIVRTLKITDNFTKIGSVLTALCIIPLLIIFAGVWSWFSRRRRG